MLSNKIKPEFRLDFVFYTKREYHIDIANFSMQINIYYGSTRGNTHIVVSHLTDIFHKAGYSVLPLPVLTNHIIEPAGAYIFACGTYGHGILQEHMDRFIHKHNKNIDLNNTPCGAIGLGDDKYDAEYNMESASILHTFIEDHNGNSILEPLKINKSPLPHLKSSIQEWGEEFIQKLK